MSEANKSLMLSEAEIIEAINSDSLISVSLGAGQPQKNVKMSTLATVAAGLISKATLSSKGLIDCMQIIPVPLNCILSLYSNLVFNPLGLLVFGVANGVRSLYFVNPAEYNSDGAQIPLIMKLGATWANPVEFYYKRGSDNNNRLAIKTHTNGSCTIVAFGSNSQHLSTSYITDLSDYNLISVKSL